LTDNCVLLNAVAPLMASSLHPQAAAHNVVPCCACCYAAGSGRRVGENCEQFWAMIKPFTTLTRYMAKPNYLDFVDDAIFNIACQRLGRFVQIMQELDASLRKKLGEYNKKRGCHCHCCLYAYSCGACLLQ
jgi:hypothetical protein